MDHEIYIKRCLQIAKNGIGTTRPNPSVGAVIVCKNKIIGEGFTSPYGKNHAEVNAVNSVKNKTLLKDATIYVTLEPCVHFGKTPPCADLLIKHQFKQVVIGCLDTNNLVSGKGIERLKNTGIKTIVGVLETECRKHHKRFFTVQEKNRPFIVLKWAETKDGFMYPELDSVTVNEKLLKQVEYKNPIWISNSYSQQLVHKLRSKEHAILVGTNTVLVDNPKLNIRSWSGENPIRIVLDRSLRIPKNSNVLDGSVKTIILKESRIKNQESRKNVIFESVDFPSLGRSKGIFAKQICEVLHKHNIQSVIIEGGTRTLQTFIDENLWDEANVFIGNTHFKKGLKAPIFSAKATLESNIKNDGLKIFRND